MKHLLSMLATLLLFGCDSSFSKPDHYFQHAPDGALASAFSHDASFGITSSINEGIVVWDLEYNQKVYQWNHQSPEGNANVIGNINVAFDKSHVVTADRDAFALWNLETGEPVGFWRIDESSIRDLTVSNGGRAILIGRGNGKVLFFEPQTGRRLEFLAHQEKINSVALSPNGNYALTGSNDYTAYLWDTRTGQVLYRFDHPSRVTKVALHDDGRYAFTADSQKHARIWDLSNGEEVSRLHFIQRQKIFSAARFSKDGKTLLTGSPDRALSLWDVATGELIQDWKVKPSEDSLTRSAVVYAVEFYGDNQVISASSSGWVEVWNRE